MVFKIRVAIDLEISTTTEEEASGGCFCDADSVMLLDLGPGYKGVFTVAKIQPSVYLLVFMLYFNKECKRSECEMKNFQVSQHTCTKGVL